MQKKLRPCSHCRSTTDSHVSMICAGDSTMYLCIDCQQAWWNLRDAVVKDAVAKFTSKPS